MLEQAPLESPGDLAWTKLLDENTVNPVCIKIEDLPKESPTSTEPPPELPGRKQSIFNTFQRQVRMSLKAVSDSPGPISRYSR